MASDSSFWHNLCILNFVLHEMVEILTVQSKLVLNRQSCTHALYVAQVWGCCCSDNTSVAPMGYLDLHHHNWWCYSVLEYSMLHPRPVSLFLATHPQSGLLPALSHLKYLLRHPPDFWPSSASTMYQPLEPTAVQGGWLSQPPHLSWCHRHALQHICITSGLVQETCTAKVST